MNTQSTVDKPDGNNQAKPADNGQVKPIGGGQTKPMDNIPIKPMDNKPAKPIDNVPVKTVNNKPATPPAQRVQQKPVLRFSPTAWAKLLYFCHHGQTEIGGFGITAADDLLYVQHFQTVQQEVTGASVAFDDNAVADFFDQQVDSGYKPERFGRIWLHTHPGNSATPSSTDEETFQRVFGRCQWAIMFILARGGKSYARLRFNTGPGGQIALPVETDYRRPFVGSNQDAWQAEYKANIHEVICFEPADCFLREPDLGGDRFFYDQFDQELQAEARVELLRSLDDSEALLW
jgi:hypothetical protein